MSSVRAVVPCLRTRKVLSLSGDHEMVLHAASKHGVPFHTKTHKMLNYINTAAQASSYDNYTVHRQTKDSITTSTGIS